MSTEHVERMAKRNLERGERWHKKLSIKEIVFGFQDNSIAILALLAGVMGGSLRTRLRYCWLVWLPLLRVQSL